MHGIWTALVTPFDKNSKVDLKAYKELLKNQKAAKVAGVIPCGTTGEAPTLSEEEKKTLILMALEELKGSHTKVVAGTGTNDTAETVAFSQWASKQGVAGVLLVTPYYNKPTQFGLFKHFLTIAEAIDCEVMLYNVPGRTAVSLTPETIVKLAAHPKITTLKEASGSLSFLSEIRDQLSQAGKKLDLLTGDDVNFLPSLALGARGIVSVASNLFPRALVALQSAFEKGNLKCALEIHTQYYPLFRDLFIESNPGPIKAALAYAGWCGNYLRLPLVPMQEASQKKLEESLKFCKILSQKRQSL